MNPAPRIFLSVRKTELLTDSQIQVKNNIKERLRNAGFSIEEFLSFGYAKGIGWNNEGVCDVLAYCQGAIIMAFEKWKLHDENDEIIRFTSGYHHYEGALILAQNIPTLIIAERGLKDEGVLSEAGGRFIAYLSLEDGIHKISKTIEPMFNRWRNEVNDRCHVFLGYSSAATSTAQNIRDFLAANGVRVMDWKRDFETSGTILKQIERATQECLGGIFLFTRDDALDDNDEYSPRDNVLFEAGYFMHAKGDTRTLIILEEGTKFPKDIGGHIYLDLQNRHDIVPIQARVLAFVRNNL